MKQMERKRMVKRLVSMAFVLCMAASIIFGSATEVQAKSKYQKSVTKTFKIPAYSQYQIWVELSKPGYVKAQVTTQAKKKADCQALVALGSGNGEKYITAKKKTVTLRAKTNSREHPKVKKICLYLTNGSSKAVKYKVKFSSETKGAKVRYLYKDFGGGGAG